MREYKRLTERCADEIEVKACMTCETPTCDACGMKKEILHRLADLETKIEAGKLVELPCKVGDTVYSVGLVFSDGYEFDKKGHETPVNSSGWRIMETEVTTKNIYRICDECVNKRAFLTREAAEARLKELE